MLKSGICVVLAAVLSLGGCATVSVIPGAAPAQEIVSIQQSELRTAASSFSDVAVDRGWIQRDPGLMRFAQVLAHGNDTLSEAEATQVSYAALIGVGEREPDSIVMSLASDVNEASSLMATLSQAALTFLDVDLAERGNTSRADLVSFERTLVQAQKVRRTFADTLFAIGDADTSSVDAAMVKFDRQIDRARLIADRLAREYTSRNVGAVS